jgi:sialidase-1
LQNGRRRKAIVRPTPEIFEMVKTDLVLLIGLVFRSGLWAGPLTQQEIFRSGEGGYHTYRIPALIATQKGTLLAFCEGRRNSGSDTGDIDVLLRRSFDNGKTWTSVQKVADMGNDTIGNPTPVLERKTGTVFLLLTSNPATAEANRAVWISRSNDDGAIWTTPVEITSEVKKPEWTWYATGPGNGIQLRSGRLVIPCDHNRRDNNERHSHIIYSDDRGETWKIGGIAEDKTNESAVAETRRGDLVLNMRSYHGANRRAIQRSKDAGITLLPLELDQALIDPVCEASLIADNGWLIFSNPAATTRTRMTVRLSKDNGRSWPRAGVIYDGPSAYSSLAVLRDKAIGLLYERGDRKPYERITFARFKLSWIN